MTSFWTGLVVGWGVSGIGSLIIFALLQANHWGENE